MASTDARPVAIKNTAYRLTFPIYKSDGTLISGAAGLDSEVSKDAGTFADCTNEATEIATSSGIYYLDITSTEMNADCVAIVVKTSSTGAVIPSFILYPQESGDIKVDVQSYGGSAGTFASGRPEVNMTHIAGSAVSTAAAQIGVNVVNQGGSAGTFASGRAEVNVSHWSGTAVAAVDTAGYPKVTVKNGTGTGELALSSGAIKIQTNLKKNQALAGYTFVMTNNSTHNPQTGLTVTATRSLDGGAFASGTLGAVSEVSSGAYKLDLGAGDMNANVVTLRFTASGADDLMIQLLTEP